MLNRSVAQLPPGVVDYYFKRAEKRRNLEQRLRDQFRLQGFQEVITPTFEYFDVFRRGMRDDLLNQSYRFFNRDGDLLTLRADSTCAVARLVATKLTPSPLPLRLFYINPVFRKEAPHAGKFSEFVQAGVELIGTNTVTADFELLKTAITTLQTIGLSRFQINLGHVGVVNAILTEAGLSSNDQETIRFFLGEKRLPELDQFLVSRSISSDIQDILRQLPLWVGKEEILKKLEALSGSFQIDAILTHLNALYRRLNDENLLQFVTFDLGNLKGMRYYTGILFEIFTQNLGFPIGSGGRYDQLLQKFGADLPAVGFSFTLERLEAVL
ncbi:MAG: ATP phosphoribosyltransferase regulatory subunit [Calditrichaeota bacterium]|nr:ATP phosphoribosyltransferase regulatory subunit [Calditrichota bacterium]